MKNRSELLLTIRPTIKIDNSKSTEQEIFQGVTIRPILKLQNELILSIVNNYLSENKISVKNLTDHKKIDRINEVVKNNLQIKLTLIGLVIAHFTEEEINFYHTHKKEVVKRIITMVLERICSQLTALEF